MQLNGGLDGTAPETVGAPMQLTAGLASRFARLALHCLRKEYPHKLDHVLNGPAELKNPRSLHPAFFGCFDWHSAVHGHWMLARLLRLYPDLGEAGDIVHALGENLSPGNIPAEAAYLAQPNRQSFERTYGWAWLLKLGEELGRAEGGPAVGWRLNLEPLVEILVSRYREFLPKQNYPIRTGVHANTAFGLAFALDFARAAGHDALEELLRARSEQYFATDEDYPAAWEPSGEDFFSPALLEADLMRRVMEPWRFRDWFGRFLPDLSIARYRSLLTPVRVTDRRDPKLAHLDGLNLSRAWCLRGVAASLPPAHPARSCLLEAAERHAWTGLQHVASGEYAGEHWLASFAVYLLTAV